MVNPLTVINSNQNPEGLVEIEKAIVSTLIRRKERGISIRMIKIRAGMPALNITNPAIKTKRIRGMINGVDVKHTTIEIIAKRNFSIG